MDIFNCDCTDTYNWTCWWRDEQLNYKRQTRNRSVNNTPEWDKMEQAYSLILNKYVEKVDGNQLIEGAIQGMVATLKDSYSVYMDKEMAEQFNEVLDSSFGGIGTEIGMEDGKIIIVSPYKDSPAEKAGLKPKDEFLKVDGESVKGLDLYETSSKIRGEKGTSVKLEISQAGISNPITFTCPIGNSIRYCFFID